MPPRRYPHLGSTHGRVADAGVMQEELTGAHTEARATKADLEATTESLRLALDPLTLKSTFGVYAEVLVADSDLGLIILLCVILCGALIQRFRQ